jgi:hypothetical protein
MSKPLQNVVSKQNVTGNKILRFLSTLKLTDFYEINSVFIVINKKKIDKIIVTGLAYSGLNPTLALTMNTFRR